MAELKWLEDLVVLMEEDSFTKAAERRHVTQPAFSRRIRLLEDWLGIGLVERQRKPISILPAIRTHESEIRELVSGFYQLRNNLQNSSRQDCANFVVQHTLAVSHFPTLIKQIQSGLLYDSYRLHTANNEDCPALFSRKAQYMLCYERPDQPILQTELGLQREILDYEVLLPVIAATLYSECFAPETAAHSVHPPSKQPLPVLVYPEGAFLAETLAASCLPQAMRNYPLTVICESALAISLKEMVLAGMGIAWLPKGLISKELHSGKLIPLNQMLGQCELLVCLYSFNQTN